MIAVDTSVLVAVLKKEDDSEFWTHQLLDAERLIIGAPTKFELLLVMAKSQNDEGVEDARALLALTACEVVPWTDPLADIAADAVLRFGKGRHNAALNFGDCMAYALAKSLNVPLLFKGNDFSQTDIKSAV